MVKRSNGEHILRTYLKFTIEAPESQLTDITVSDPSIAYKVRVIVTFHHRFSVLQEPTLSTMVPLIHASVETVSRTHTLTPISMLS